MIYGTVQKQPGTAGAVTLEPHISIVLPFEPKMSAKPELAKRLELAVSKVAGELEKLYSEEFAFSMLQRLKKHLSRLNFSTYKKSIAVFVSPEIEKTYYLDIEVEEHVEVEERFGMRDLVRSKKDAQRYLLLVLSAEKMKIYLGNSNVLIRIMSNVPDTVHAYENDIPERVGNFTDSQARKEVMLEKFMHHTDQAVSLLLKAYPLPLVLMATERTAGHFKKTASCSSHIMSYIHGNFDDAADGVLQAALFQTLEEWKISRQLYLLSRLNTAMNAGRLAIGIGQVLKEACMQKGQLLLVEKNYTFPAGTTARPKLSDQPFYITDTVDRVIEKVLESGGDVEFVDHGRLKAYRSIALVKYY